MEWLVCSRGRPERNGWVFNTREDALARIARGALDGGCPCHFLFEDSALLSLTPDFMGCGSPWGVAPEASEARFRELLSDLGNGAELTGAVWHSPRQRLECFRELVLGKDGEPRFDMVLAFREKGDMLLGSSAPLLAEARAGGAAAPTPPALDPSWHLPRVLGVIGGVRDVSRAEERELEAACPQLWFHRCTVSLGRVPELTSKCIKTVGALQESALLAPAVHRCWSGEGLPAQARQPRGAFHLIVLAPTALQKFTTSPAAATLLVDVFIGSCCKHARTLLTIIGADGNALTIRTPGPCLREHRALRELSSQCSEMARPADVKKALLDGQRFLRCGGPWQLRVLHADETMPPLVPPLASGAATGGEPSAVAVVFADASRAKSIRAACLAIGVQKYERASVGGLSIGPAYVGALHSAGLLAPAISTPAQHSLLLAPEPPRSGFTRHHTRSCKGRCALCWKDKVQVSRFRRKTATGEEGVAAKSSESLPAVVREMKVAAGTSEELASTASGPGPSRSESPPLERAAEKPAVFLDLGQSVFALAGPELGPAKTARKFSESESTALVEADDSPSGLSDVTESLSEHCST